ncbi:MAG: recombinase family protein [Terracidiphilus sp.]
MIFRRILAAITFPLTVYELILGLVKPADARRHIGAILVIVVGLMVVPGIFASIAEFERELIRSRVRIGLAAAKSKGKKLGRPRTAVEAKQVAALRATGASWRVISQQLGIGVGTACRALQPQAASL